MKIETPADHLLEAGDREQLEAEAAAFGISPARLLANRNNARASSGPKTDAGKARSSLNSSRHSLTGQLVCKTAEELEAAQKFTADIFAECLPQGPSECAKAIAIAENELRLARIRQIEDGIYAEGFRELVDSIDSGHPAVDASFAHSKTFLVNAKSIALLGTYEQRIRKGLRDDRAELKAMQAERKAAYGKAMDDAVKLAYYAQEKQDPDPEYDPAEDFEPAADHGGFVYDLPEVADWARRQRRLEKARWFFYHPKRAAKRPSVPESEPESDRAA